MVLYDLNVPWSSDSESLQRTLSFLSELGYTSIALNHIITSSLPSKIVSPIPEKLPFTPPSNLGLTSRCTLTITDPSLNHRLRDLIPHYSVVAVRPTTEKAFLAACLTITDASIISLDLTQRYPFHFRPKPLMTAIKRGLRFELCYAQLTSGGASERRNCIMNIQSIVRATGGRGLIVSSEAKRVLGVRAPADVSNLMVVWGLNAERAVEAVTVNPRSVLVNEGMKRTSFRGVVNVLEGGERTAPAKQAENKEQGQKGAKQQGQQGKRKTVEADDDTPAPLSKRQQKKLRLEALKAGKDTTSASASASEGAASS